MNAEIPDPVPSEPVSPHPVLRSPEGRIYFSWPWDYFPLCLPSCRIDRRQERIAGDGGEVVWRMDRGLPLLCEFVDEAWIRRRELLPEPSAETTPLGARNDRIEIVHAFSRAELRGCLGLTFVWVFYTPIIPYVPRHPMGVIWFPGTHLSGMRTTFEIRDTRRPSAPREIGPVRPLASTPIHPSTPWPRKS